jgi:Flp pilus assembly protein TadG
MTSTLRQRAARDSKGQSLIEFAIILPFLVLLSFGVAEIGFLLLDQHVVTKLTREGSNLISRNTTLQDGMTAMTAMSARPVDFSSRSKLIFSVIKKGATTGTANYDRIFLYQRFEYGAIGGASHITTAGSGAFGGPPNYEAVNSDNNTGLQVTNAPANLITPRGGMIYITEIYNTHQLLTPVANFGLRIPTTLYSIAYF